MMNKIRLTSEEKEKLETQHKKSRDVQERDRIKAVLLNLVGGSP